MLSTYVRKTLNQTRANPLSIVFCIKKASAGKMGLGFADAVKKLPRGYPRGNFFNLKLLNFAFRLIHTAHVAARGSCRLGCGNIGYDALGSEKGRSD